MTIHFHWFKFMPTMWVINGKNTQTRYGYWLCRCGASKPRSQ